jgi:hypothetical protein
VVEHAADWLLAIETARHGRILRLSKPYGRHRVHPRQISIVRPRDETIFRDGMRTLDFLERQRPDLAPYCPARRRMYAKYEAFRWAAGSTDRGWINAGLRTALHYDPTDRRLWRSLLSANARHAAGRLRRAFVGDPG